MRRVMIAGLLWLACAAGLISCESPQPAGREPAVDLRSRDITWPTLDGRMDRPAEPALPEPEELE